MARRHERQSMWPLKHWKIGGLSVSRHTGQSKFSIVGGPTPQMASLEPKAIPCAVPRNHESHRVTHNSFPQATHIIENSPLSLGPSEYTRRCAWSHCCCCSFNLARASSSCSTRHGRIQSRIRIACVWALGLCLNLLGYIAHIILALYRAVDRYYITGAGRTLAGTTASPHRPSQQQRPNRCHHSHA